MQGGATGERRREAWLRTGPTRWTELVDRGFKAPLPPTLSILPLGWTAHESQTGLSCFWDANVVASKGFGLRIFIYSPTRGLLPLDACSPLGITLILHI